MTSDATSTIASTDLKPAPMDVRRAPLRATVARAIFERWTRRLPIRVTTADGSSWGLGGAASPELHIVRPTELYRRIGRDSNIGFGEAFQSGAWTSPDPAALLTVFAGHLTGQVHPQLQVLRMLAQRIKGHLEPNTHEVAKRNVESHYDLSNDMFATFLDSTMTYSSAWFDGDQRDLETAQLRKIDGILDYAGVTAGTSVLEIGTGWGALAIRAAQRGARVTSLTLSSEQKNLAQERIREVGLADRVTVLLQDYRDAKGSYDAVVSVEMIEAVGEEYWPEYFATINRLVKPGGRATLQAITMPHERMLVSRRAYTWINKYIFPGGLIPSVTAIEECLRDHTGLRIAESRSLGPDYAETLSQWHHRFTANWPKVERLGFDEMFRRTWEYYLAYCEAGFRTSYIDVLQLQLTR
jgi:cyclopropane-fatty-acyl-phospholipid synthase